MITEFLRPTREPALSSPHSTYPEDLLGKTKYLAQAFFEKPKRETRKFYPTEITISENDIEILNEMFELPTIEEITNLIRTCTSYQLSYGKLLEEEYKNTLSCHRAEVYLNHGNYDPASITHWNEEQRIWEEPTRKLPELQTWISPHKNPDSILSAAQANQQNLTPDQATIYGKEWSQQDEQSAIAFVSIDGHIIGSNRLLRSQPNETMTLQQAIALSQKDPHDPRLLPFIQDYKLHQVDIPNWLLNTPLSQIIELSRYCVDHKKIIKIRQDLELTLLQGSKKDIVLSATQLKKLSKSLTKPIIEYTHATLMDIAHAEIAWRQNKLVPDHQQVSVTCSFGIKGILRQMEKNHLHYTPLANNEQLSEVATTSILAPYFHKENPTLMACRRRHLPKLIFNETIVRANRLQKTEKLSQMRHFINTCNQILIEIGQERKK